jgi:hypothetical protein
MLRIFAAPHLYVSRHEFSRRHAGLQLRGRRFRVEAGLKLTSIQG